MPFETQQTPNLEQQCIHLLQAETKFTLCANSVKVFSVIFTQNSILHLLTVIATLSQTVWELWPAQNFGFRGDNYITKIVRVVSLTCDIPTGPPLHSYQILSKYV